MTLVEEMAEFVSYTSYKTLSSKAVLQLKIRVLDAIGCAIGALSAGPVVRIRALEEGFGGSPLCTLIGDGKTSPDRAALYNGALIRYLDFNDSFLAKGETCHPSDNVAPVLAASEYSGASGKDFLTALAVAYQVQCRMSEVAPVRAKGFDHSTQGAYAVAAGASRALSLSPTRTANAIAIAGAGLNALRVTRTGRLSNWKGLAYPFVSFGALTAVFMAAKGITGPLEVFEGNKGFMDSIAGKFEIDWKRENLEAVTRTIVKKYNAEVHSQSAIECILALQAESGFKAEDVESIDLRIFDVAYNIIGGGEEGNKKLVETKEQADHSLPYILSAALLDGEVTPRQYLSRRIIRGDVQSLLRKVNVRPDEQLSSMFPNAMPCVVTVRLKDGNSLERSADDYEGFFTRPMSWDRAVEKFHGLTSSRVPEDLRMKIEGAVRRLDQIGIKELTSLLGRVGKKKRADQRHHATLV
ncbi:MAG: MmgE/PrpD family protein [Thaumarchaeota archaeon]|nr:MmgE/PrpD family protein [Nitrososphaerota archaeon]